MENNYKNELELNAEFEEEELKINEAIKEEKHNGIAVNFFGLKYSELSELGKEICRDILSKLGNKGIVM